MKPRMMSKSAMDYLFHHILDGFRTSHEGIIKLEQNHLVTDAEIEALLKKNSERLIDRIREFRLLEKLTCIFFAVLFLYMQVQGEELDMRRPVRTRTTSVRSARSGRRRSENE